MKLTAYFDLSGKFSGHNKYIKMARREKLDLLMIGLWNFNLLRTVFACSKLSLSTSNTSIRIFIYAWKCWIILRKFIRCTTSFLPEEFFSGERKGVHCLSTTVNCGNLWVLGVRRGWKYHATYTLPFSNNDTWYWGSRLWVIIINL